MTRTSNLTCIGHVYGAGELALLRAAFEAAEIPLLPDLPNAGVTVSTYATAFGGIALYVPRGHVDVALDLAAALDPMSATRPSIWAMIVFVVCILWATAPPPATGFFPRHQGGIRSVALDAP